MLIETKDVSKNIKACKNSSLSNMRDRNNSALLRQINSSKENRLTNKVTPLSTTGCLKTFNSTMLKKNDLTILKKTPYNGPSKFRTKNRDSICCEDTHMKKTKRNSTSELQINNNSNINHSKISTENDFGKSYKKKNCKDVSKKNSFPISPCINHANKSSDVKKRRHKSLKKLRLNKAYYNDSLSIALKSYEGKSHLNQACLVKASSSYSDSEENSSESFDSSDSSRSEYINKENQFSESKKNLSICSKKDDAKITKTTNKSITANSVLINNLTQDRQQNIVANNKIRQSIQARLLNNDRFIQNRKSSSSSKQIINRDSFSNSQQRPSTCLNTINKKLSSKISLTNNISNELDLSHALDRNKLNNSQAIPLKKERHSKNIQMKCNPITPTKSYIEQSTDAISSTGKHRAISVELSLTSSSPCLQQVDNYDLYQINEQRKKDYYGQINCDKISSQREIAKQYRYFGNPASPAHSGTSRARWNFDDDFRCNTTMMSVSNQYYSIGSAPGQMKDIVPIVLADTPPRRRDINGAPLARAQQTLEKLHQLNNESVNKNKALNGDIRIQRTGKARRPKGSNNKKIR